MLKRIFQAIMNFLRKIFGQSTEQEHVQKNILSFAINDYPGTDNDLNGCIPDQNNVKSTFKRLFPAFKSMLIADSQTTIYAFTSNLRKKIEALLPGDTMLVHYSGHGTYVRDRSGDEEDGYDEALFLYDGALIDDDINEILQGIPDGAIVVVMLDSCFSGTATRSVKKGKNRFVITEGVPAPGKVKSKLAKSGDMKWITFSGSGENQTSADAYINGSYNGAFTYFAMKYLEPGITYDQWHRIVKIALADAGFSQIPQIEGPAVLRNSLVFY